MGSHEEEVIAGWQTHPDRPTLPSLLVPELTGLLNTAATTWLEGCSQLGLLPLASLPQDTQGEPGLAAGSLSAAHTHFAAPSAKCVPGPQGVSPLTIPINLEWGFSTDHFCAVPEIEHKVMHIHMFISWKEGSKL